MKEPNELFKALLGEAAKNWTKADGSNTPLAKEAARKIFWFKIGIFLFLGAAILKVIFRTNFGVKAISLFQIGIASLSLSLWALICLIFAFINFNMDVVHYNAIFGGRVGLIISSIFHFIMAFYTFSIGSKERRLSKNNSKELTSYYRGDSVLLAGLLAKGWSQKKIQERAEPLLALAISIFLSSLNPLLGLPLLLCSISLVLNQIYENIFQIGESKAKRELRKTQNKDNGFSSVK